MKEFPANGFVLVEEFEKLPWQHMMFFGKDEKVNSSAERDATDSS
jgi:hypothetical protein